MPDHCWDCGAEAEGGVCTNEHRPGAYLRGRVQGYIEQKSASALHKRWKEGAKS